MILFLTGLDIQDHHNRIGSITIEYGPKGGATVVAFSYAPISGGHVKSIAIFWLTVLRYGNITYPGSRSERKFFMNKKYLLGY